MTDETVANPSTGGAAPDIHTAAMAIEGILEPEGPTEEDAPAEEANPDEAELEAGSDEDEQESEAEADESSEDDDDGEPTDTLEALAKVLETDEEVLTSQLKVPVKIDGETSLVTLQEALSGYQRDSDYQRKMAEVGEQRRELEAAEKRALERLQPKFERLNAALQSLEGDKFTNEDFQRILSEEGVEAALLAKSQAEQKQALADEARSVLETQQKEAQAKHQQELAEFLERERVRVIDRIPALADQTKAVKIKSDIRSYLQSTEFSDEEIGQLMDSRMVKVAYDAMRYSAIEKSKPQQEKRLKKLPKVLKGGKGEQKKPDKGVANRRRLARTGDVRDAVSVIEEFL